MSDLAILGPISLTPEILKCCLLEITQKDFCSYLTEKGTVTIGDNNPDTFAVHRSLHLLMVFYALCTAFMSPNWACALTEKTFFTGVGNED